MKKSFLLLVLAFTSLNAMADVYKCPGDRGPVYTQTPGPGCEKQNLQVTEPTEQEIKDAKAYNARRDAALKQYDEDVKAKLEARRKAAEARTAEERARIREEMRPKPIPPDGSPYFVPPGFP